MKNYLYLVFLFLVACGQSPLMNHKDAADKSAPNNNPTSSEKPNCSMMLDHEQICASLNWQAGPQLSNESPFQLVLKSVSTQSPIDINLQIVLWMPAMGHGSAPVKITKISEGTYQVQRVYFLMSGDWEIKIYDGQNLIGVMTISL